MLQSKYYYRYAASFSFVMALLLISLLSPAGLAATGNKSNAEANSANKASSIADAYLINPGDVLAVFVWEEQQISQPEVLVRPDGNISIPMLGEVTAGGRSVAQVQTAIATGLAKFLKVSPSVTVSIKAMTGNAIYVLGKVNRPGQYVLRSRTDVSQALALAGGVSTFAAEGDIKILRRDSRGQQKAIEFNYNDIKDGDELETNIILRSGDVVIVP